MHASDTVIENCTFGTGHGASIGSLGMATALRNITVRDSTFTGCTTALRIKADNASSGYVTGVAYMNLAMQGCGTTIDIGSTYPASGGDSASTLRISSLTFANITSAQAGEAGSLLCSGLAPCTGLSMEGVTHTPAPHKGWLCKNVQGKAQGAVSPPLGGCLH
jgi:hypothetical protein